MGAYLLFGLALAAFLLGLISEDRTRNTVMRPDRISADLSGFVAYKTAVQAYVSVHPGTSGTIPLGSLSLTVSSTSVANMNNLVVRTSTGTQVQAWALNSVGGLPDALAASENDRAIGTSTGGKWQTPTGGDMGPLAQAIPVGDVVSLVVFSGTGF